MPLELDPPVLDVCVCLIREHLGDDGPVPRVELGEFFETLILVGGPDHGLDERRKVVPPSFTALAGCSAGEKAGDSFPRLIAVQFDELAELHVLFGGEHVFGSLRAHRGWGWVSGILGDLHK